MQDVFSKAKIVAEAFIATGLQPLQWLAAALIAAIIGLQVFHEIQFAKKLSNETSPIADGYSERNELSAGTSYAVKGFTKYMGLPDHSYQEGEEPGRLYLRYPQGPALILGLAIKIFGPNRVVTYRMIAIGLRLACLLLLAYVLAKAFGILCALFFFTALWQIPMSYNMMHGIGQNSYQVSLLYFQIAAAIYFFVLKNAQFDWRLTVLLFVVGFCHGTLSLDFCFVATFAALPIAIMLQPRSLSKQGLSRIAYLVVPVGLGFVFAFSLHALQVILYYDLAYWYADLTDTAHQRSEGVSAATRMGVFLDYYYQQLPKSVYLSTSVKSLISLSIPIVALTSLRINEETCELPLRYLLRAISAGIAAYFVSSLWLLTMPTHAWIHTHFIPRHYLLFVITVLLAATIGLRSASAAYGLTIVSALCRPRRNYKVISKGLLAAVSVILAWTLPFLVVTLVIAETKRRGQSSWQVLLYRSGNFDGNPLIEHIDKLHLPAKQGFGLVRGTTGALSYRFLTCAVLSAPTEVKVSAKSDLDTRVIINGERVPADVGQNGEKLFEVKLSSGRHPILVEAPAQESPQSDLIINVKALDGVEVQLQMPRRPTFSEDFCI